MLNRVIKQFGLEIDSLTEVEDSLVLPLINVH